MGWLKKLFSKKPPAAAAEGDESSPWGSPKKPPVTGGVGGAGGPGGGAPDSPSKSGRVEPWIAVFRAIKNPAEQGKVDAFVERLEEPEQRKLFAIKKLGDIKEGVRQVTLDGKQSKPGEIESVAKEWFRQVASGVKPGLAPGDYWGVSFVDGTGAQRQFLMHAAPTGGAESKEIVAVPGGKPVSKALMLGRS